MLRFFFLGFTLAKYENQLRLLAMRLTLMSVDATVMSVNVCHANKHK